MLVVFSSSVHSISSQIRRVTRRCIEQRSVDKANEINLNICSAIILEALDCADAGVFNEVKFYL